MYKGLLPIGSVVLLKDGQKRIMITGRVLTRSGDDTIYDYAGCYYPEGIGGSESTFFFNRDAVGRLYFIGFQDEEELAFRQEILNQLGELEVRNGEIVPKAE